MNLYELHESVVAVAMITGFVLWLWTISLYMRSPRSPEIAERRKRLGI